LASNQERHFGKPPEMVSAVLTECDGYVTGSGIAVLEIGEVLPHNKELQSSALNDHWLGCIHAAINRLAEKARVPVFDMAMVGFRIAMPRGANNARMWDASNRALNLVINNLKGVFFPDDNIEHMAFAVLGCWAEAPKTTVYIGDYHTRREEIIRLLDRENPLDCILDDTLTDGIRQDLGEWISGGQQV
jgi:hypothetical protein